LGGGVLVSPFLDIVFIILALLTAEWFMRKYWGAI